MNEVDWPDYIRIVVKGKNESKKGSETHLELNVGYDAEGGLYCAVSMKSKKSRFILGLWREGKVILGKLLQSQFSGFCLFYKRKRRLPRRHDQSRSGAILKQKKAWT